ncbi:MAG: ABC transporter ATP-binding protein [Acidimicrobiia bacterium]|nr:ABC transporter ATP-binding protein [Acidimicrobiia bacterium]
MPRIHLDQVSGQYRNGAVGLHPTDLVIESGELVAVVGPSGSGKTTLIRLIAGLGRPATGTLRFDGVVMNDVGPARRGVALVHTQGALYDHLTSEDNIRFPLRMTGIDEPEQTARTEAEADRFHVRRLLHRRPRALSAGERQLVATSKATVRDASVLLFDEALAGVDPHLRHEIRDEFRRLHDGTHTIVYATNEQEEAMVLADRLVVLDQGVVQQVGAPLTLHSQPDNVFVAEFLGSPGMNIVPGDGSDGRLHLGGDEIAGAPAPSRPGPILVGIRPEDVRLARPGDPFERCLHARVTAVEMLGSVRIAHVAFGTPDSGALDFAVRVTDSRPVFAGDSVELFLAVDRISYFDPVTGVRL